VYAIFSELAIRAQVPARLLLDEGDLRVSASASMRLADGLGEVHLSHGALELLRARPDPVAATAAVFGHELGHLAARDVYHMRGPVFAILVGALTLLAAIPTAILSGNWAILVMAALCQPALLLVALLRATYGERKCEFIADDYAAALTGNMAALAEMLESVTEQPSARSWRGVQDALLAEHPSSAARAKRLRVRLAQGQIAR
jgi:Zn-dependent protease with chaperone function